jgi:hypothetical protein
MSLFARLVTRNLVRNQRLCRHLTNFRCKSSEYDDKRRWNYAAIACAGAVGIAVLSDFELPSVEAATPTTSRRSQFNFIADVVETASKSLVYIEIQDTRRMDYYTGKAATVSNGSGFIVESDGLILTNAHVVINKPRSIVSVRLNDGRSFQGIVEAVDPVSDLATVRIQCRNLPTLKLGNSSSLRSGEFVVALGSPLCEFSWYSSCTPLIPPLFSPQQHCHRRRRLFNPEKLRRARPPQPQHQLHSNRRCHHVRQLWRSASQSRRRSHRNQLHESHRRNFLCNSHRLRQKLPETRRRTSQEGKSHDRTDDNQQPPLHGNHDVVSHARNHRRTQAARLTNSRRNRQWNPRVESDFGFASALQWFDGRRHHSGDQREGSKAVSRHLRDSVEQDEEFEHGGAEGWADFEGFCDAGES